jgi:hypothetical protein
MSFNFGMRVQLWGNCAAGAVRGGLEPAIKTGEFDVDVLRQKLQVQGQ